MNIKPIFRGMLVFVLTVMMLTLLAACQSGPSKEELLATNAAETVQALNMAQTAKASVYEELTKTAAAKPPTPTRPAPTQAAPPTAAPVLPTKTAPPSGGVAKTGDGADFVGETIPDGTSFNPGATFIKTWTLKNTGTTTWTTAYSVVFMSGNQMGSAAAVNLSQSVQPGNTVVISLPLTAPTTPGKVEGAWKLRNDKGVVFGLGSQGTYSFTTVIEVSGTAPTVTATGPTRTSTVTGTIVVATGTPTATSPAPTVTPTATTVVSVTSAVVSQADPQVGVACGSSMFINAAGSIAASAAGSVTYTWSVGGVSQGGGTLNFGSAGTLAVAEPLTYTAADGPVTVSLITVPAAASTASMTVVVDCN